jgi:hypothetical protein
MPAVCGLTPSLGISTICGLTPSLGISTISSQHSRSQQESGALHVGYLLFFLNYVILSFNN